MNPQLTFSQRQWLHSSVGRASHRYREVTGSNPFEVMNFFQASFRNCINCVHCDDHFFIFKSFQKRTVFVLKESWSRNQLMQKVYFLYERWRVREVVAHEGSTVIVQRWTCFWQYPPSQLALRQTISTHQRCWSSGSLHCTQMALLPSTLWSMT